MNTMNLILRKAVIAFFIIIASPDILHAQDTKKDKEALVQQLVETKNYVFVAETALPTSGRIRQLTSGYELRVSGDTINSYLPYFGRAYVAPINPAEGGIEFTSQDFEYTAKAKKKGGWNILINPKDAKDVRQLILDVS